MAIIDWNEGLESGIPELDADHRLLVGLLNGAHRAVANEAHDEFRGILGELGQHTASHFEREEALMVRHRYHHVERHREEHRRLYQEMTHQIDDLNAGLVSPQAVSGFMRSWLLRHIIDADLKFSRGIAARAADRSGTCD